MPWRGIGDTLTAIALSNVGIWIFAALIMRGVEGAAAINKVVTIARVIPILVFVLLCVFDFNLDVFRANLRGAGLGSVFSQVRGTMLATVFVFLGVEGASVCSRYAKKREHVGQATLLGFVSVLAVFASVTIVAYGILPRAEIAQLRQPSMAGMLEAAVGQRGAVFVSAGLIVSVLGAYLAWTLMAPEVLFVAANDNDMPRFLRRANASGAPTAALLMTTVLIQIMLFVTLASENAFDFALNMTSALSMIPFVLAAGYALKLTVGTDAGERHRRYRARIFAWQHWRSRTPSFSCSGRRQVRTLLLDRLRTWNDLCS